MIRIKNSRQIDGIRRSCALLAEIMDSLEREVVPGISTLELDRITRERIESRGGRPAFFGYQGFPGSICASVNEQVIHGIPNTSQLNAGDILSIDCGIELDGYFSDSAITIPVGAVTEPIAELLTVTRFALEQGIEAARFGNRVNDISRAVYEAVRPYGYGVVRPYCGHGVGLDLHEDPQVPNYIGRGPNPRLKPGMTIAIEPMINLGGDDVEVLEDAWTVVTKDRSISAHYEHTVLILKDRTEVLTRRATERSILHGETA